MIMAKHTEKTVASPATIWKLWSSIDKWAEWDVDLDYVRINGPFKKGARGHLKPKGFFRLPFSIIECKENVSFTDQTNLILGKLVFTHTVTKTADGCEITHRAEARGLFGWILGLIMGRSMRKDLPLSMKRLVEAAEKYEK